MNETSGAEIERAGTPELVSEILREPITSGSFRDRRARGENHLQGPCLKLSVLLRMWLKCFEF